MKSDLKEYVVVGNGLGVLQLLQFPELLSSKLSLNWKPSFSSGDRSSFFVVGPSNLVPSSFGGPQKKLLMKEIFVYFQKTQRYTAEELLYVDTQSVALSLRKKVIALSLFNDLSPQVWNQKKEEPIFNWIRKSPLSLSITGDLALSGITVISQKVLLQEFHRLAESHKASPRDQVHSIKLEKNSSQAVLSFAPPLQAESFKTVICTDYFQVKKSQIKISKRPVAYWQSFITKVPRARIAALPFFSVWTDTHSETFLKTGHLQDQCLKRVIVVGTDSEEECLLQIQVLRTQPEATKIDKVQKFLFPLCPRLESLRLEFQETVLEDDLIFEDPLSSYDKYSDQLLYWHAGSLGESPEFFRKILKQIKLSIPSQESSVPHEPT